MRWTAPKSEVQSWEGKRDSKLLQNGWTFVVWAPCMRLARPDLCVSAPEIVQESTFEDYVASQYCTERRFVPWTMICSRQEIVKSLLKYCETTGVLFSIRFLGWRLKIRIGKKKWLSFARKWEGNHATESTRPRTLDSSSGSQLMRTRRQSWRTNTSSGIRLISVFDNKNPSPEQTNDEHKQILVQASRVRRVSHQLSSVHSTDIVNERATVWPATCHLSSVCLRNKFVTKEQEATIRGLVIRMTEWNF